MVSSLNGEVVQQVQASSASPECGGEGRGRNVIGFEGFGFGFGFGGGGGGGGVSQARVSSPNRGVIPRICDCLFQRAGTMTAKENKRITVVADVDGTALEGGWKVGGGDDASGKRRGVRTKWTFR